MYFKFAPFTDPIFRSDNQCKAWHGASDPALLQAPVPFKRFYGDSWSGPMNISSECKKPVDFFSLFIDDQYLQLCCNATNARAINRMSTPITRICKTGGKAGQSITTMWTPCYVVSHKRTWLPVTVPELKGYLSYALCAYRIPGSVSSLYRKNCHAESVQSLIPRERLRDIIRNFCLPLPVDSSSKKIHGVPQGYELVQTLIDRFNYVSKLFYMPGANIVIDEACIPNRAPSHFYGCIPRKPHPNGQFYDILGNDGYIYHVELRKLFAGTSSAGEVYHDLLKRFISELPRATGYNFFLDQGYGGESIAQLLISLRHNFCVSCTANRPSYLFSRNKGGLPSSSYCLGVPLPKGAFRYAAAPDFSHYAMVWADRSEFHLLTNLGCPTNLVFSPGKFRIHSKKALPKEDDQSCGVDDSSSDTDTIIPAVSSTTAILKPGKLIVSSDTVDAIPISYYKQELLQSLSTARKRRKTEKHSAKSQTLIDPPVVPLPELYSCTAQYIPAPVVFPPPEPGYHCHGYLVPEPVYIYRQNYHGIDRINRRVDRVRHHTRYTRWFSANIFGLLRFCLSNAYTLFCTVSHERLSSSSSHTSFDTFIESIATYYRAACLSATGYCYRPISAVLPATRFPKSANCIQIKLPQPGKCSVCYTDHKRSSTTRNYCKGCSRYVHPRCFELLHSSTTLGSSVVSPSVSTTLSPSMLVLLEKLISPPKSAKARKIHTGTKSRPSSSVLVDNGYSCTSATSFSSSSMDDTDHSGSVPVRQSCALPLSYLRRPIEPLLQSGLSNYQYRALQFRGPHCPSLTDFEVLFLVKRLIGDDCHHDRHVTTHFIPLCGAPRSASLVLQSLHHAKFPDPLPPSSKKVAHIIPLFSNGHYGVLEVAFTQLVKINPVGMHIEAFVYDSFPTVQPDFTAFASAVLDALEETLHDRTGQTLLWIPNDTDIVHFSKVVYNMPLNWQVPSKQWTQNGCGVFCAYITAELARQRPGSAVRRITERRFYTYMDLCATFCQCHPQLYDTIDQQDFTL